jgi:hypothetical protein
MNWGWWIDPHRPWYFERPLPWSLIIASIGLVCSLAALVICGIAWVNH